MRTHWNTLRFTESEIERVEEDIAKIAAREPAVHLLAQLVGFGMINAVTVIAAIGDIARFPKPGKLVRYAGLDSIVKQSSDNLWTGRISKAGRADLRSAMVDVATHAAQHHPYWNASPGQTPVGDVRRRVPVRVNGVDSVVPAA